MNKSADFRIGLFVAIGLLALSAALFKMEAFGFRPERRVRILFNFTDGLEAGAPVQLSGVGVGSVEKIRLTRDASGRTRVEVTAKIRQDVALEPGARFRIGSYGILGTKYMSIDPGPGGDASAVLPDLAEGVDPVAMDSVMRSGERIVAKFEQTMDAVNGIVGSPELKGSLKDNSDSLAALLKDLRRASASLNEILDQVRLGKGTLGKLIMDDELYREARAMTDDLKANPWKLLVKKR